MTDKPVYAIDDLIRVTYTVPGPGRIVITDHQSTGVSTPAPEKTPPGQGQPEAPQAPDKAEAQGIAAGLYSVRSRETGRWLQGLYAAGIRAHVEEQGHWGQWQVEPAPDGYVFLRGRETSLYLDSNAADPGWIIPPR